MFLANETLQAICRTFLHSLWQGVIAAALAGIILWGTRHSSARIRYNLLGSLLLLTLLASGITFYTELRPTAAAIADITSADIDMASAVLPSHPGEQVIHYINAHADWLMLIWGVIFLLKCFRLGSGFYYIHRIRKVQVQPVPTDWEDTLKRLSHSLKIRKAVQLLESGIVKTPLTIGFFKPVIFLPLGLLTQLPADQVETILLHELAHIRRKDFFVNMLQSFTETIFFFNPAFLWISARLREEREACCDDIVVAHTPHKATYFHALVAFEEQSAMGSSLQIGLGSTRNHLLHRVKRMLTRENKKLSLMEKISLTFGLIAITAFSFMPEKETLAYVPPQQDTTFVVKKDKWVTTSPDTTVRFAKPRSKKKFAAVQDTTVRFAKPRSKDKFVTVPDTVQFAKPRLKKKFAAVPDVVEFPKPTIKKKKVSTTDTVLFKKPEPKKSVSKAEGVIEKKKLSASVDENMKKKEQFFKETIMAQSVPETAMRKKKSSALGDPNMKKKVQPFKEAMEDRKEKGVKQEGSKFFDDYLPEALRQKKIPPPGKDGKAGKDGC